MFRVVGRLVRTSERERERTLGHGVEGRRWLTGRESIWPKVPRNI